MVRVLSVDKNKHYICVDETEKQFEVEKSVLMNLIESNQVVNASKFMRSGDWCIKIDEGFSKEYLDNLHSRALALGEDADYAVLLEIYNYLYSISDSQESYLTNVLHLFNNKNYIDLAPKYVGYGFYKSDALKVDKLGGGFTVSYLNYEVAKRYANLSIFITSFHRLVERCEVQVFDFSEFNTHNVINVSNMFNTANVGIVRLYDADFTHLKSMSNMFSWSEIGRLEISSITFPESVNLLCYSANIKDITISNTDTSKITEMTEMFYKMKAGSLTFVNFDTSRVTNMTCMFCASHIGILDLSCFDTHNVKRFEGMFNLAVIDSLDVSSFDVSSAETAVEMFSYATIGGNLDLRSFKFNKHVNKNSILDRCKANLVLDMHQRI